jgi:hypothetical protein
MRGCFSLVGTFDALDARKVSIIAKGVGAILVHELRSARAMHRRERGRRPGRSLEWLKFKKLTVRKSGIQARHLYISARKRSGLLFDHPLFDRHARNFRQKLAHAQIPHLRLKFELHLPT